MPSSLELAARLTAVVSTQQEVLASISDIDRVMNLIVVRTPIATSGTGAVIEIVDGTDLVYRAASGTARDHIGLRLPSEKSLSGKAVRDNALIRCDDTELDIRVDGASCRAIGIRSMIIAPLVEQGTPVGALKTYSDEAKAFGDLDAYALQLLAGMTSSALTQAHTFRERERSEARYRMLFDRNVAGVFRSTLDGGILDCNDALVQYLGYDSRDDLLAHSAWELYHQRSDRERVLELIHENRAMLNMRVPFRRKDGSSLLGVMTASLVPGDGAEQHLLGTIVES